MGLSDVGHRRRVCRVRSFAVGIAPQVSWTRAGRYRIAYTCSGAGKRDIVFMPNWFSNCELVWEYPPYERFLRRLESFSRLIVFDRRGVGISDPLGLDEVPTIDERTEDLLAVLDAVAADRVTVIGGGVGSYLPLYFAATHPGRCSGLVVLEGTACVRRRDDYPIGVPSAAYERLIGLRTQDWGAHDSAIVPYHRSPADNEFSARYQRQSVSRGRVEAEMRFNLELDLRELLGAIHVPTLVVHHSDNAQVRVANGRYIAEHVAEAQFAELDGEGFFWADDGERVMDVVEHFLTGSRRSAEVETTLATVLYTDIVESASRAAAVGDRYWQTIIDDHERMVRQQLADFHGREVKTLGDGFLATFSSAQRAIACAQAIVRGAARASLEVRAGLHTGEIELRSDGDIAGIAVVVANRVLGHASGGEVVVSQTVKDLVLGAKLGFVHLGQHQLKGVPDRWHLWLVATAAQAG